ncbi:MAG: hypothetical protein LAT64_00360 [Phycisphaerales bacterium]|nr:hypothetical protein [Planctomycetota bacterium]MCH8507213.1 hypothetical protein [Phycisphaerales bacterium]
MTQECQGNTPVTNASVPVGHHCKQCGYNLSGLDPHGQCPECGLPVERSLTDDRLSNSSLPYLRTLNRGVTLILISILVQLLVGVATTVLSVVAAFTGQGLVALMILATMLGTVASLATALGWWYFSEPDPGFTGRFDGTTARQVVRVTVLINAGIAIANAVVILISPSSFAQPSMSLGGLAVLSMLFGLVGLVSWAVSYFASMLYLRWLSPRIPNWWAHRFARTMMWLGPVLYVPGSCLVVGPIAAMVLYLILLNSIRKDLVRILAEHEAEPALTTPA